MVVASQHCPARPSLRLATAWCWSGSSGSYRLWRTEEEEEVRSCGAWGAARPRWVLRQAAGCGAPPTTTHRQKPPGHNPHAASTSPNLRKKITKKSLCGKLFCILTVKLSVTKGKEAWRGLIWWRALGRCLVKKNNRRAD